jgi:hypothetical protein
MTTVVRALFGRGDQFRHKDATNVELDTKRSRTFMAELN